MYSCKILLDSINPNGDRLTSFEITFPRFILAEVNTHRMLSRSVASSRAIPFKKMVDKVKEDPFIPFFWGKNQSGMQANEEIVDTFIARSYWLLARDRAIEQAQHLHDLGVHKQLVNRLLEPYMYCTAIVSATTFKNFFKLRTHKDAQPEFQKIASMMEEEYVKSVPNLIAYHQAHLPLIDDADRMCLSFKDLLQVSAARCARVSYLNHEGVKSYEDDLRLFDRLVSRENEDEPMHLSPLEHCAIATSGSYGNFTGWKQYRKFFANESGE